MMITSATSRLVSRVIHRHTGYCSSSIVFHRDFSTSSDQTGRNHGINFNPNSIVSELLPGGKTVLKTDRKGEVREVMVERAYGYFWMMKDLIKAENKPILASEISEENAREFPTLLDFEVLGSTGSANETVDVPNYFLKENRARDPSSQCTLVGLAYRDFGYKMLSSWIDPFEAEFEFGNPRAKAMRLSITEGRFTKMLLSSYLTSCFRKATPLKLQSQTLLCYGPDPRSLEEFNSKLGIHNTLAGYIFLLDGLGRVRFAGSGKPSETEVKRLIELAKELTPKLLTPSNRSKKNMKRVEQYF